MKTISSFALLSVLAITVAANFAAADPLEIFGTMSPTNDVGMSGTMGVELTGIFPNQTFLVGVELRGFSSADRKTRYFWVSGEATFNEGVVYQDATHNPDTPYVDVNITPVTTAIEQVRFRDGGHTASAIQILPLEMKRDLRWGTAAEISVRAFGVTRDLEMPLSELTPEVKGFLQAAVDVVGFRYLSQATYDGNPLFPNPVEGRQGLDIGALKAKAGINWDINKTIALRLSVGLNADAADVVGGGQNLTNGLVASADVFARMELIFRHVFTHWSLFTEVGERARWEQGESAFTKSYGFVQVGLMGQYY
ncbi:MAG: hypothetical protein HY074_20105 [Deltaproteobacteria bacterium]|nr:hypothetical protein [Deltaproteobacteria bacterium]